MDWPAAQNMRDWGKLEELTIEACKQKTAVEMVAGFTSAATAAEWLADFVYETSVLVYGTVDAQAKPRQETRPQKFIADGRLPIGTKIGVDTSTDSSHVAHDGDADRL